MGNPDINPETPERDYLPECHGTYGDCTAGDNCCNVHRGLNWTQAVCKCREYGGDVATPYNAEQDAYMFAFIEEIYNQRYNFSNPSYCSTGSYDAVNCPF